MMQKIPPSIIQGMKNIMILIRPVNFYLHLIWALSIFVRDYQFLLRVSGIFKINKHNPSNKSMASGGKIQNFINKLKLGVYSKQPYSIQNSPVRKQSLSPILRETFPTLHDHFETITYQGFRNKRYKTLVLAKDKDVFKVLEEIIGFDINIRDSKNCVRVGPGI